MQKDYKKAVKEDSFTLDVLIQPRSSRDGIEGFHDGRLKVKISAPPVDGKANERLTEVVADAFGVPKSRVEIIKGRTSRQKTLRITGLSRESYDSLVEKYKQ